MDHDQTNLITEEEEKKKRVKFRASLLFFHKDGCSAAPDACCGNTSAVFKALMDDPLGLNPVISP